MRKITTVLIAAVAFGSLAAPVSAEDGRTVTRDYSMAQGTITGNNSVSWRMGTETHVFKIRRGEKSVSFAITDATGQAAVGHVHLDADGDGDGEVESYNFCSATDAPIELGAAKVIEVQVLMGTCENRPAVVTRGTITATFHN